jgi:hypothetical protein
MLYETTKLSTGYNTRSAKMWQLPKKLPRPGFQDPPVHVFNRARFFHHLSGEGVFELEHKHGKSFFRDTISFRGGACDGGRLPLRTGRPT